MKRSMSLMIIVTLILAVASVSYAASSRRGKKVFAKVCKECHVKGSEAGKLKPSEKTMSQWRRFIKKNKHTGGAEIIDNLSKKDRRNLQKFLLEYALDADVAETCG